MDLERKFCAGLGELEVAEDGTVIAGYASVFGVADQGGDIVEAGAYAAALTALAAGAGRIKMLWQHDPTQPIGVWDEVREDGHGLFVRGRILTQVARGREAVALIAAGAIDGLSIGYRTLRAMKDDKGRRRLSQLELWEVSLVTFPMLSEARVAAKGDEGAEAHAMRELAAALRTARHDLTRL